MTRHAVISKLFPPLLLVAAFGNGCRASATEDEIRQMCDRLLVLRKKSGEDQNANRMKADCIEAAKKEGVSRRQALCRIAAVNTQEYWNRCRTGAARSQ